uniref:Uncharacterized protein n=1 Tax=Oreochromis aureus TaxID=47969 RepID=A0A668RK78_OREAU
MKKHTMGIYVINKEDGQNGHYDDIGSLAQACALMHYYEFIQKVLMGLDGEKLSPKVLGLKNKIFQFLIVILYTAGSVLFFYVSSFFFYRTH